MRRRLGWVWLRRHLGDNNTRQGHALRSTLKPAGYFHCVEVESAPRRGDIEGDRPAKPVPTDVGTPKSRGFFLFCQPLSVAIADGYAIFDLTTPLTPLDDAHQEGLLVSGAGE